ncbi:MAG: hypothetical protein UE295_07280 [Acutalibacteraceae bacterium]|nr:hypothetical protein [Acutalibacteraceae bacterium]
MTFSELEENLNKLKFNDRYCNLIKQYHNTPTKVYEMGLYVNKKANFFEVYYTERGSAVLAGIFYDECSLYEYMFCYFKKNSDCNSWFGGLMTKYPEDLIKKLKSLKVLDNEYSFCGKNANDCLYVEAKKIIDNGEISHGRVLHEDGTAIFDIQKDYFEKSSGVAEAWEVNDSNQKEKNAMVFFFRKMMPMIFFSI